MMVLKRTFVFSVIILKQRMICHVDALDSFFTDLFYKYYKQTETLYLFVQYWFKYNQQQEVLYLFVKNDGPEKDLCLLCHHR